MAPISICGPQGKPSPFLCSDLSLSVCSFLGGFFRTDFGGRHGPYILEAPALVSIQIEIGTLALPVGWGAGFEILLPLGSLVHRAPSWQSGSGFQAGSIADSLRDGRIPSTLHSVSHFLVVFKKEFFVYVILKGNNLAIPVLLRER